MKGLLHRRRLRQRELRLRRDLASTDRERAPLAVARICHDLAHLAIEEERRRDAIRWLGQSIDAYIYAGFVDAAAAMCGRLIRYEPNVIRARATLAMLHLASRRKDDALAEIRAYVEATRRRGERAEVTEGRLLLLASLADDVEVRRLIGESLVELGAVEEGREILRTLEGDPTGGRSTPLSDQERWRRLLDAALQAGAGSQFLEI